MTIFLLYIFIFLLGLIIGSFLNCVIYRMEISSPPLFRTGAKRGGSRFARSALSGRSYCPHCKHQLCWYDLIPVLSFIILKGKCRYCRKRISLQYPLVELATAFLFVLIFWHLGLGFDLEQFGTIWILNLFFLFTIASFLIIIFVYDLKHYIIPDKVIFPAIGFVFLYQLFEIFEFRIFNLFRISDLGFRILAPLTNYFVVALGTATLFLAIVLITKGKGMGIGDIKLAFLMGLLLGWPSIFVALFLAFLIGAIIGIGLILTHKKTLKSEIPFGPFLVTGTFIALFWGEKLINFYLNLFT